MKHDATFCNFSKTICSASTRKPNVYKGNKGNRKEIGDKGAKRKSRPMSKRQKDGSKGGKVEGWENKRKESKNKWEGEQERKRKKRECKRERERPSHEGEQAKKEQERNTKIKREIERKSERERARRGREIVREKR